MLSASLKRLGAVIFWPLTLILGAAAPAQAGPWSPQRSPGDISRGGANVVTASDPSALAHNPAALAALRGLQLMVDGNLALDGRTYATGGQTVRNLAPVTPRPGVFVAYNLGAWNLAQLTLAGGWYAPPQSPRAWPPLGPQRFTEITGSASRRDIGLGVAYEFPWWSMRLGATALLTDVAMAHSLAVQVGGVDVPIALQAAQQAAVGGLVALALSPFPWLGAAVSFQYPQDVLLQGTLQYPATAALTGQQLSVQGALPAIWRVAVQFKDLQDHFDVEAAWVREGWGRGATTRLYSDDLRYQGAPVPALDVRSGWRDADSFHLGGHFRPPGLWNVDFKAGLAYHLPGLDTADVSVAAFDVPRLVGGLGVRVDLPWRTWVELAGGYTGYLPTQVQRGRVQPARLVGGAARAGPAVNEGRYGGQRVVVALGLGVALDL